MHNKQQYFQYFRNPTKPIQRLKATHSAVDLAKNKASQYQLAQNQKLLPHIIEEYQYRITNQLLEHKINHPRRDKIIVEGVLGASANKQNDSHKRRRLNLKEKHKKNHSNSQNHNKMEDCTINLSSEKQQRVATSLTKKNHIQRLYKTFGDTSSTFNNYNNDYLIALQNTRMGKRLINTRSMVTDIITKNFYTYQIYNGKLMNKEKYINRSASKFKNNLKNVGRINNGIKSFFHNKNSSSQHSEDQNLSFAHNRNSEDLNSLWTNAMASEDKSLKAVNHSFNKTCDLTTHAYQTKNPFILEAFGKGDFTFLIKNLVISSNPPLKPESLLLLQIIEGKHKLASFFNSYVCSDNHNYCKAESEQSNGFVTSSTFTYEYISNQCQDNFGIKFKVHRQKELFIRVLKNQGIQQRQLGIFKIDLISYFTKKPNEFSFNFYTQEKEVEGVLKKREIFESQFEGNLFKLKKGQTDTTIKVEYLFYNRHYYN